MKKVMKNLTVLFLSAVILLTSAIFVSATEQESATESTAVLQEDSINQYNLMLMAFKHSGTTRAATEADIEYPDYYAGSYINEDNDLVVKLTEDNLDKASEIHELTRSNNTIIESATYSYNELVDLKNNIWNQYLALYNEYENKIKDIDADLLSILTAFVGVGVKEDNNCVVVSLKSTDNETLSCFRKYFSDSSAVSFEICYGSEEQNEVPTIYSGNAIYGESGAKGSVGFRSRMLYNGITYSGFFTAEHVISEREEPITYTDNDSISYINAGWVVDAYGSGSLDAAFIAVGTEYTVAATTRFGVSLGDNYFTSLPEGSVVTMCGQASSSALSGEIVNTSFNFTKDGETISDTYRCNYTGASGDSGGVVYREISGSNCIVGIHAGKLNILYGFDSYVIKASNIYAHWSLYLY